MGIAGQIRRVPVSLTKHQERVGHAPTSPTERNASTVEQPSRRMRQIRIANKNHSNGTDARQNVYQAILKTASKRLEQAIPGSSEGTFGNLSLAAVLNLLFLLRGEWGSIGDYVTTQRAIRAVVGDELLWAEPQKATPPLRLNWSSSDLLGVDDVKHLERGRVDFLVLAHVRRGVLLTSDAPVGQSRSR